jgi:hypothetical protein
LDFLEQQDCSWFGEKQVDPSLVLVQTAVVVRKAMEGHASGMVGSSLFH